METQLIVVSGASLLFSGVGAYIGAYLREKGKNLATREDFFDLKEQLRQTTRLTEEVKQEVGHAEWRLRENHALRRSKIEEYAQQISMVESKIGEWLSARVRGEVFSVPETDCIDRLDMLSRLYFPRLLVMSNEYIMAWRHAVTAGVETAVKFGKVAPGDLVAHGQLIDESLQIYERIYPDTRRKRARLEEALTTEMSDLLQDPIRATKPEH